MCYYCSGARRFHDIHTLQPILLETWRIECILANFTVIRMQVTDHHEHFVELISIQLSSLCPPRIICIFQAAGRKWFGDWVEYWSTKRMPLSSVPYKNNMIHDWNSYSVGWPSRIFPNWNSLDSKWMRLVTNRILRAWNSWYVRNRQEISPIDVALQDVCSTALDLSSALQQEDNLCF